MARLQQIKDGVAQEEEVITFPVYQPNDEPYTGKDGKPSTWSVVGEESRAGRAAREAINRRNSKTFANNGELDQAEVRKNRIDFVVACTRGWTGWEDDAGNDWPCEADNIRALLAGDERLLVQVERKIRYHARFFVARSAS